MLHVRVLLLSQTNQLTGHFELLISGVIDNLSQLKPFKPQNNLKCSKSSNLNHLQLVDLGPEPDARGLSRDPRVF